MHQRKKAHHAKSQLLYLQMIMLKVDSEYARYKLSVPTARFNYIKPLNNRIYTPCQGRACAYAKYAAAYFIF